MSFNAKNLSYGSTPCSLVILLFAFIDVGSTEANEPAFLRRLKSQYGGGDGRENPQRRPKKPKNEDDDDAPTYVEEGSHEVISKEEYEALVRGDDPEEENKDESTDFKAGQPTASLHGGVQEGTAGTDGSKSRQNVAGIGGPKKRKQAKVVGEELAEEKEEEEGRQGTSPVANKPKQKKKKKKVKLSFDED